MSTFTISNDYSNMSTEEILAFNASALSKRYAVDWDLLIGRRGGQTVSSCSSAVRHNYEQCAKQIADRYRFGFPIDCGYVYDRYIEDLCSETTLTRRWMEHLEQTLISELWYEDYDEFDQQFFRNVMECIFHAKQYNTCSFARVELEARKATKKTKNVPVEPDSTVPKTKAVGHSTVTTRADIAPTAKYTHEMSKHAPARKPRKIAPPTSIEDGSDSISEAPSMLTKDFSKSTASASKTVAETTEGYSGAAPHRVLKEALHVAPEAMMPTAAGDVYQRLGGTYRPKGMPLGISKPTEQDDEAAYMQDIGGLAGSIAELGTMVLEMDEGSIAYEDTVIPVSNVVSPGTPGNSHNWGVEMIGDKRHHMSNQQWNVTMAGLTPMAVFRIEDALEINTQVSAFLRNFAYVAWDSIDFDITYNSNVFYAGIGKVIYMPGYNWYKGNTIDTESMQSAIKTGDGIEFFANESSQIVYNVPWAFNKDWYPIRTTPCADAGPMGNIIVAIISGLKVPPDQTTYLEVNIGFRFNGLRVSMPVTQIELINTTIPMPIFDKLQLEMDDNTASSIQYYPTTSRYHKAYRSTSMAPGMSGGSSNDYSEMSIASLTDRPGFVETHNWSTTHPAGTLLDTWKVQPIEQKDDIPNFSTPIAFASQYATYWTGSIVYRLDLARSGLHKGKLAIVYYPHLGPKENILTTFSNQPHMIFDISTSNSIKFRSPNSTSQALRIMPMHEAADQLTNSGTFALMVYSPLIASGGMDKSVEIVRWIMGSQESPHNYRIFSTMYHAKYYKSDDNAPPAKLQLEFGEVTPTENSSGAILIGEDISSGNIDQNVEEILTISQYLVLAQAFRHEDVASLYGQLTTVPYAPGTRNFNKFAHSYISKFSHIFAYWRGDMNIMAYANTDILVLRQTPRSHRETNWKFGAGPGMVQFKNAQTMSTATLSSINYNNFFLTLGMFRNIPRAANYGSNIVFDAYQSDTLARASKVAGYISATDDFWYGGYTCIPNADQQTAWNAIETLESYLDVPDKIELQMDEQEEIQRPLFDIRNRRNRDNPFNNLERYRAGDFPAPEVFDEERNEFLDQPQPYDEAQPPRRGFFSALYNIPGDIQGATASLNRAARAIADTTVHAAHRVQETTDVMTQAIRTFLENMGISGSLITSVILLAMDLGECLILRSKKKWIGFGAKLAVVLGLNMSIIRTIVENVFAWNAPNQLAEGQVHLQMDINPSAMSSVLAIVVMAIGVKITGANKVDEKKHKTMWEYLADRGQQTRNIKNGVTDWIEMFKWMHDTVMETLLTFVFPGCPELTEAMETRQRLIKFEEVANEIHELSKLDTLPLLTYDVATRARFETLYTSFSELENLMLKDYKDKHRLGIKFNQLNRSFEKLCSAAIDNAVKVDIRVDPYHVSVYGDPGVGKSFMSYALMNAVCESQKRPRGNRIYPRTEGMDFYDNYSGQYCFYVDDMDMVSNEETSAAHIQRKSNVPVILNMADLKKKGMYFMSKLLCSTTNTPYPNPTGITCPEAYLRRRDLLVQAQFKAGETKYTRKSDFSHLKFALRDPILPSAPPIASDLDYTQLVAYLVGDYSQFMVRQTELIRGMNPDVPIETIYSYPQFDLETRVAHDAVVDIVGSATERRIAGIAGVAAHVVEIQGAGMSHARPVELEIPEDDDQLEHLPVQVAHFTHIGIRIDNNRLVIFGRIDEQEHVYAMDDPMAMVIIEALIALTTTDYPGPEFQAELRALYGDRMNLRRRFVTKLRDILASGRAFAGNLYRFIRELPYQMLLTSFASLAALNEHRVANHLVERFRARGYEVENYQEGINALFTRRRRVLRVVRAPRMWLHNQINRMEDELPPLFVGLIEFNHLLYSFMLYIDVSFLNGLNKIRILLMDTVTGIFNYAMEHWNFLKWVLGLGVVGTIFYYVAVKDDKEPVLNADGSKNVILEGDTLRIQTHAHADLPDDKMKHRHVHLCEKCNGVFAHTHEKHTEEHSKRYVHLCRKCRDGKIKKNMNSVMGGDEYIELILDEEETQLEHGEVNTINAEEIPFKIKLEGKGYPDEKGRRASRKNKVKLEAAIIAAIRTKAITAESFDEKIAYHIPAPPVPVPETADQPQVVKKVDDPPKVKDLTNIVLQGTSDPNAQAVMAKVILNQGTIRYGNRVLNFIGLKELKILTNGHIFAGPKQKSYPVTVTRFGVEFAGTILASNIRRVQFKDVSTGDLIYKDKIVIDLITMPQVNAFANIMNHFIEERDLPLIDGSAACLSVLDKDIGHTIMYSPKIRVQETVTVCHQGEEFHVWKHIEYNMPTKRGYCGAPLFVLNARVQGKIIGIHNAGHADEDLGYAQLLTREELMEMCGKTTYSNGPTLQMMEEYANINGELSHVLPMGRHLIIGTQDKPSHSPLKSDIHPSPIFDRISPHITEPAILSTRDPRTLETEPPMKIAIQKFNQVTGNWNLEDRYASRNDTLREFINATTDYAGPKRILTLDEAINGIPGYLDGLNMRTSPGYPYTKFRPAGSIGKTFLFEETSVNHLGQMQYKCGPRLQADVDKILRAVKEDRVCVDNFYEDKLKDERRPIEKLRVSKTRAFNVHSCAWLVVNRMYYGASMAAYIAARLKVGSGLGLDMNGPDVSDLVNYLREAGALAWDGDVSKWDGGFDNETMEDTLFVLREWLCFFNNYDEETAIDIMVVGHSLFWRFHVCGKVIYIPLLGMPSGHLLTSAGNTTGHNNRRRYVWRAVCRASRREDLKSFEKMREHTREVKVGDDTVGTASQEISEIFNPEIVQAVWQAHGIEFVPPTKIFGAKFGNFRNVEQVQFLKCTFARQEDYPNFYVAKMDINTILEVINWIRYGQPDMDALESNIDDAQRFLFGHGRSEFDRMTHEIEKALADIGQPRKLKDYEVFEEEWLNAHGM